MERNKVIATTSEVYRLTLLFPKKEPLRYKIREVADDILARSVTCLNQVPNPKPSIDSSIINLFDVIDSFFEVAKFQNWVKEIEISNVQADYTSIKEGLKKKEYFQPKTEEEEQQDLAIEEELEGQEIIEMPVPMPQLTDQEIAPVLPEADEMEESQAEMNDRQKRILDILKRREGVQVWEIKDALPDVSKRTLRRDFQKLLNEGLVERRGDKNTTFYQLKEDRTSSPAV